MPVLQLHLVQGQHAPGQIEQLLLACSQTMAEALQAPVERIRVFASEYTPTRVCIGGRMASEGAPPAPYFSLVLMQGRALEEKQKLQVDITGLIENILGVERSRIRGGIFSVSPDEWCIGGRSASAVRQAEIASRAQGSA